MKTRALTSSPVPSPKGDPSHAGRSAGEELRAFCVANPLMCGIRTFRNYRDIQDELSDYSHRRRNLWFRVAMESGNLPAWPCCYVIYLDGSLTYIGQTDRFDFRVRQHVAKGLLKGVCPSRVTFKIKLCRRYGEWAMTELRLIRRIQPILNTRGKILR